LTDRSLTELKGVGAKVAERLASMGLVRESDVLFHLPLRYEDRTTLTPIQSARPGQWVQIEGTVVDQNIRYARSRMLVATVADDTGQVILRFFRFYPNQQRMLTEGQRVRCFGQLRWGHGGLEMAHPQCTAVGATPAPLPSHLDAVYPTCQGVSQPLLRRLIEQALDRLGDSRLVLAELLDDGQASMGLRQALTRVHRPGPDDDLDALINGSHPATQRLAMEELLAHHLTIARQNKARATHQAPALVADSAQASALSQQFLDGLGFEPTAAQRRVIKEVHSDIAQTRPMRRLLQGDVGSGKTVVAGAAVVAAAAAGVQSAIIAPTELLAEQHLRTFRQWLAPLGLEVVWLSGKVTGLARKTALSQIEQGAEVIVGTHALFQEPVEFARLGLAIIDEQHRFGVHQRLALASKGRAGERWPHQLVMTATPIPRTLAMTAYAGLDVSVIDELPPGRKPVTTVAMSQQRRDEVIERLRQVLATGRQAYWVCPLIEESDALEAEAAETRAVELKKALPHVAVDLVHGRMKSADKQAVMARFSAGETGLLVATTVIEVGVDVPNASLMMIENAERLGLSQLHQLRGRVGRGSDQAACVLLYKPPLGELAQQRLEVMRETTDGFVIAEKDLELRGPGEVLGTRQTGMMRFRIADLGRDADLIERVHALAPSLSPAVADQLIERWVGHAEAYIEV
jgi:ATP-dependent DNA helicase RecG